VRRYRKQIALSILRANDAKNNTMDQPRPKMLSAVNNARDAEANRTNQNQTPNHDNAARNGPMDILNGNDTNKNVGKPRMPKTASVGGNARDTEAKKRSKQVQTSILQNTARNGPMDVFLRRAPVAATDPAAATDNDKPNIPDGDEEEEVDDKPKIPGIQNLGNTCYLSASLQTLYSIPQFLHKLYQSYEELCSFKELPLTTALLEVAVTIGALKEEDVPMISPDTARSTLLSSKAANPSALKKQMDVLTNKFAGYEQRDAHEFLGDLVDLLHEELVDSPSDEKDDESKKLVESNSEEDEADEKPATVVTTDLPTDEYFHLKVSVCLKCKSCGYSRSKEELYRHLSIDVGEDDDGESWGVERSLEHFFEAEDRELNCEKCEDGTTATQTIEIISR
jgi:hypothetical protein